MKKYLLLLSLLFLFSGCGINPLGEKLTFENQVNIYNGNYNLTWLLFTNLSSTGADNFTSQTSLNTQEVFLDRTIGYTNLYYSAPSSKVILKLNGKWVCTYEHNGYGYWAWSACQLRLNLQAGDQLRFENYPIGSSLSLAYGVKK